MYVRWPARATPRRRSASTWHGIATAVGQLRAGGLQIGRIIRHLASTGLSISSPGRAAQGASARGHGEDPFHGQAPGEPRQAPPSIRQAKPLHVERGGQPGGGADSKCRDAGVRSSSEWVFQDDGYRVLAHSPDRLSRKYAYQILLAEKCNLGSRRGKRRRAQQGTINVISDASYGYRYVKKSTEHQCDRPPAEGSPNSTRTGSSRWERGRNPRHSTRSSAGISVC